MAFLAGGGSRSPTALLLVWQTLSAVEVLSLGRAAAAVPAGEPDVARKGRTAVPPCSGSMDNAYFEDTADGQQRAAAAFAAALGCTARAGDVEQLDLMLTALGESHEVGAAALDMPGHAGWRASHEAAMMGHVAVLEFLLLHSVDMNAVEDERRTPLHWAVLGGHLAATQSLLASGADPHAQDSMLASPLHGVVVHGHAALAELLLDARADVAAEDAWQQTLLHGAAIEGHAALVRLLLERGAPVDVEDAEGRTPLKRALLMAEAQAPGSAEVLELFAAQLEVQAGSVAVGLPAS